MDKNNKPDYIYIEDTEVETPMSYFARIAIWSLALIIIAVIANMLWTATFVFV